MGTEITRETFDERDYARFAERLEQGLSDLGQLLARPGFGAGPVTIGAELELFLVDDAARPLPRNEAVRSLAADPRITLELNRFNLELNASPCIAGRTIPARSPRSPVELGELLDRVSDAARAHQGRVALIGILPTLSQAHLGLGAVTDAARYRALDHGLRRLRRGPFLIRIAGDEPLELTSEHVTLEGANTSFQVHLRVAPGDFTRIYNAAQLATAPALAAAGNSPTFLGRRLWEETRIALFKQSVEDRDHRGLRRGPSRSALGTGWLRGGALELFTESVRLHEPLLPCVATPARPRTPHGAPSPGRAQAAPGHGLALEPGHLRPRVRGPPADRDAGPAGRADRDRHAGQRGLPDRPDAVAGRPGRAVDLRAAVRAGRPRLLPRGPARPGRRAELAGGSRRPGPRRFPPPTWCPNCCRRPGRGCWAPAWPRRRPTTCSP